MGKKQRNKKASAAAAAAAAAKAKAGNGNNNDAKTVKSANDNNNNNGDAGQKDLSKFNAEYRSNLKKLMKLAQESPSKSKAPARKSSCSTCSSDATLTDSDDMPELEDVDKQDCEAAQMNLPADFVSIAKQSRGEKKARRLLNKLDLKPVENVSRVAMRKSKNILLYIDRPEVFKCPHTETYICFGDIRVEDISNAAAAHAAERYRLPELPNYDLMPESLELQDKKHLEGEDDDDEELDAQGLDEKDIELVQMQAACSRKKAIRALLKNDNDVVNAIMALTVA
ncbi:nascent polypeptide-associated complex subunit alpha [Scaptodrosophila lebanonensis]|uniref:Nascent polypeptide-associated complex subunit alpha n=1 Tax=Drosophila lebanonensis TaxID=7225 RepID=A0A6J2U5K7_DROLE|nr:nascent polypeptide-associated complex subunit alpha [Scaptodrosophila lebanonensis]XP_030383236.1 nascent polypeptide-associated complex subunit alpha [Scaptodrosophila lebanonensis]XP_030383237.1 nascent polypeptide-associated complex subunit alpha [Scaptodrosophila lebanonensis]